MKRYSSVCIFFLLLLIWHCDKNPAAYELKNVYIARDKLADLLGDADGTASSDEKMNVTRYLIDHPELWAIGVLPESVNEKNEAIITDIQEISFSHSFDGPYGSEAEIREHCKDITPASPWIGIFVFVSQDVASCRLKYCFMAPGENMAKVSWMPVTILTTWDRENYE